MSSGLVLTPVDAFLLVLAAFTLSGLAVLVYRLRRNRTAASRDLVTHVDNQIGEDDVNALDIRHWHSPDEPESPWSDYAVLRSLRPKEPLHRRLFKALTFWRTEEVKHEPLTVSDDLCAMHETRANEQAADTPLSSPDADHAERGVTPSRPRSWRRRLLPLVKSRSPSGVVVIVEVPEIVIHPCDGNPSFTVDDDPQPPVAASPQLRLTVHYASPPPTPTTLAISPMSSPALSEPDSPWPATPVLNQSDYFPPFPARAPEECLEVPMPSVTAPWDEVTKGEGVRVTVSNVSGNQFVLSAPPKAKGGCHTLEGPLGGLGLEYPSASGLHTSGSASTIRGDNDALRSVCSSSSESSVADFISIVDSVPSSPPANSEVISPGAGDDSPALPHSGKHVDWNMETLPHSEFSGSGGGGGSGEDHCDGDDVSTTSGDTGFYECSTDSRFGLGFDVELGPRGQAPVRAV
ncbi:hypothetical protein C8Q74DRAFT_1437779 [Fomes fomentarius]|nr:hypothetical protein C8Q74DRAFT_1437779 [Fomes fomentarius]